MKILVLSDSHSSLYFMREAIRNVKPDAVIHLGDYYDDGIAMEEENPGILFQGLPGNCDQYRCSNLLPRTLCYPVCGVKMYMTHGHIHRVKMTLHSLLQDARNSGAQAVLYGHTHCPDCHREEDGLWVLNPGSCGHAGGSVGVIETRENQILSCRILHQEDWNEIK